MKICKKNVIWSNVDIDLKNWEEVFAEFEEENHCVLSLRDKIDLVDAYLTMFKEDEQMKLNIELSTDLIDIHDDPYGYSVSMINSRNIKDIFTTASGSAEWYSDGQNINCSEILEGGIYKHNYRAIRPGYNATDVISKLFAAETTDDFDSVIYRYTRSIYPAVASVYGW